MRIILLALVLTACSCSSEQIAPDAQGQMASLASAYALARSVEAVHCQAMPPVCYQVRRMGYQAEAAYTTANGERTKSAIYEARLKMIAYSTAAQELLK
jgi:hypothetical protein